MADIFIAWDRNYSSFLNFIYNSLLIKDNTIRTILEVFIPSDMPVNDRPMRAPWIIEHECITQWPGAIETSLIASIIQRYVSQNHGRDSNTNDNIRDGNTSNDGTRSGSQGSNSASATKRNVLLVQTYPGQHEELIEMLSRNEDICQLHKFRIFKMNNFIRERGSFGSHVSTSSFGDDHTSAKQNVERRLHHSPREEQRKIPIIDKLYANEDRNYLMEERIDRRIRRYEHECDCEHCVYRVRAHREPAGPTLPLRRSWPNSAEKQMNNNRDYGGNNGCKYCLSRSREIRKDRKVFNVDAHHHCGRAKCYSQLNRCSFCIGEDIKVKLKSKEKEEELGYANENSKLCDCKEQGRFGEEKPETKKTTSNFNVNDFDFEKKNEKDDVWKGKNKAAFEKSKSAPVLNIHSTISKHAKNKEIVGDVQSEAGHPNEAVLSPSISVDHSSLGANDNDQEFLDSSFEEIDRQDESPRNEVKSSPLEEDLSSDDKPVDSVGEVIGEELVNDTDIANSKDMNDVSKDLGNSLSRISLKSNERVYSAIGCQTDDYYSQWKPPIESEAAHLGNDDSESGKDIETKFESNKTLFEELKWKAKDDDPIKSVSTSPGLKLPQSSLNPPQSSERIVKNSGQTLKERNSLQHLMKSDFEKDKQRNKPNPKHNYNLFDDLKNEDIVKSVKKKTSQKTTILERK
eukprot:gene4383-4967_t